ncbi:MAG: tetratricopeptide repeat protein [Alphaproteobacteria bacterium]
MNFTNNKPLLILLFLIAIAAGFGLAVSIQTPRNPVQREAIALQDFKNGDFTAAFKIFRKLAKQDNTKAAYYLGQMYQFGDGTAINGSKAIEWLTVAAKAGNAQAARQLGQLYLNGTVSVQDFAQARHWFEKAAHAGDSRAMNALGEMNAQGLGGPADPVAAYGYYAAAATGGNAYSVTQRDKIAKKLSAQQQAKGELMASRLLGQHD